MLGSFLALRAHSGRTALTVKAMPRIVLQVSRAKFGHTPQYLSGFIRLPATELRCSSSTSGGPTTAPR